MSADGESDALAAVERMLDSMENGDGTVEYEDVHTVAYYVYATAAEDWREFARWMGARGGKKGGVARAEKLTPERRSEIARKAAMARWHGTDE